MEKSGICDRNSVISELNQGKELANELKNQLNPTKTSREACDYLVEKILSSYDNALELLNYMDLFANHENSSEIMWEIPKGSPGSEGSNPDSENQVHKNKKRKKMAKWSEQVRVCSETGSEGQLGDGYNWRKYGQKDILGANHPRAYYRCTHRHTQGCLATKHVQRANDDPSIFEVIYRGKHSCMQERPKQNKEKSQICIENLPLKVETQELDTKDEILPSFTTQNVVNQFEKFIGTSSSPPETSETYFSMSQLNDFDEIISNATQMTNFSFEDLGLISTDQVDFDSHFINGLDCFTQIM